MTFKARPVKLPFELEDFGDHLSADQVKIHYEQHYKKYVEVVGELCAQLNVEAENYVDLIVGLKDRVTDSELHEKLYIAASQAWNHELYWDSLGDDFYDHVEQYDNLHEAVVKEYGTVKKFLETLTDKIVNCVGSNWCTLIFDPKKQTVRWEMFPNFATPMGRDPTWLPLLTVDLWEHAWYLDYQSDRKAYAKTMIILLNWKHAETLISEFAEKKNVNEKV